MRSSPLDGPNTGNKLFLGVLALAGAASVLITTHRFGIVIWPDSVYYISTARNLISGRGFVSFDGEPLTLWPPLYPALLAIISRIFGADPLVTAPFVNAIIFGIFVYLAGTMMFKHLPSSPILAIEGTLAFLVAIPLFSIAVVVFSEPLFILFVLLSFIFMGTYLSTGGIASLVLLSVSVSLSFLTRYVGVIPLLWGAAMVAIFSRNPLKKRITHLSLFALIAALPVGIWLIRNYIVARNFMGPRTPPAFPLTQILSLGFTNILDWYLPGWFTGHLFILLFLCGLAVCLIVFCLKGQWQALKANLRKFDPTLVFSIACGSFVLLYAGFVILSAINTYVSVFESRIWAPIFVPMTYLLFLFGRGLSQQIGKYISFRIVNSVFIGVIALWLLYPTISTVSTALTLVRNGDGIGGTAWKRSETVQYIRDNPAECTFYSNGPDVIYFLTGVQAKWVPSRGGAIADLSSLKGLWPQEAKVCLVWFDHINRTSLFGPDELLSITDLEQVIKPGDGVIYIVSRK